jgi:hypothetical protein
MERSLALIARLARYSLRRRVQFFPVVVAVADANLRA